MGVETLPPTTYTPIFLIFGHSREEGATSPRAKEEKGERRGR
jgi:hypothetical protein